MKDDFDEMRVEFDKWKALKKRVREASDRIYFLLIVIALLVSGTKLLISFSNGDVYFTWLYIFIFINILLLKYFYYDF